MIDHIIIGCCCLENKLIDRLVSQGITADYFHGHDWPVIWKRMIGLHADGKPVDEFALAIAFNGTEHKPAVAELVTVNTTLHFEQAVADLQWRYRREQLALKLMDAKQALVDNAPEADVYGKLEAIQLASAKHVSDERTTEEIAQEALESDEAQMRGEAKTGIFLPWDIGNFDKYATPIEGHELVVIGARPSTGKSSMACHLARSALRHGLRVVVFTLETSAGSVLRQIAGQSSMVDLRNLGAEPVERQNAYRERMRKLTYARIRVYERDMTFTKIEARCRLLKESFAPQVVIIDYLNIVQAPEEAGNSIYQRTSWVSQRMIGLRKQLGCALVVLAQLNRTAVGEDRPPEMHDLRDSGSVEQDASRIVLIHRPREDFHGQLQDAQDGAPRNNFHQLLLQRKHRTGPLTNMRVEYHAPTTTFREYQAASTQR